MEKILVLIVEDELIIAEDMKGMLRELEYEVVGIAIDYNEAEEILSTVIPDIALIDIHLQGEEDGISLASSIRDRYDIPTVFVSSYSDRATVERAKLARPEGYIVKPFIKEDLYTSVEIAVFNHAKNRQIQTDQIKEDGESAILRDHIFIRKDYMLIKIKFDDLIWIRSEMNYLELHCQENKHIVRSTLKEFVDKLPAGQFLQIHKSYCINIRYITAIDHSNIWLKKSRIPIGRSYLEQVRKVLNLEI
jgi:two-component system, LytTR family, response regulator LytT